MGEGIIKLRQEIKESSKKFNIIIGDYLLSEMEKDKLLEKSYIEKNRCLVNVCQYIINQAQKESELGSAVIDNETVYSRAKHYCLDEPIEEPKIEFSKNVKVEVGEDKKQEVISKPKKQKKKEEITDWNLLGLEL